jgi:hypothetical protein
MAVAELFRSRNWEIGEPLMAHLHIEYVRLESVIQCHIGGLGHNANCGQTRRYGMRCTIYESLKTKIAWRNGVG